MNKNAALKLERQIGSKVVHPNRREITHCFYRRTEKEIPANREEMSMWIYSKFCEKQFPNLSAKDQGHLTRYWTEVFCRPNDQWELTKKGKRKYFKHGDSLEPRYLVRKFRKDNLSENIIAELIPAIERVLNVKNLWGNEPPSIID